MEIQTRTLINVNLASNILYSSLFYRQALRISLQLFPRCQSSPCFQYNFVLHSAAKIFHLFHYKTVSSVARVLILKHKGNSEWFTYF